VENKNEKKKEILRMEGVRERKLKKE